MRTSTWPSNEAVFYKSLAFGEGEKLKAPRKRGDTFLAESVQFKFISSNPQSSNGIHSSFKAQKNLLFNEQVEFEISMRFRRR